MPKLEGAMDSAVHGSDAPGPQVQPSRTRTRNTQAVSRATSCQQERRNPVISALEVAQERWGTPVGSVTVHTGQDTETAPEARRSPLAMWRIWSEASPAMADIWEDLQDGSDKMADHGWAWLVPYWAFGVPAFLTACLARLLLDSSARPGRFAALFLAVLLFIAGLDVAGII